MPRIGVLLPLSREHHTSLVLARAARKAGESDDTVACLAAIKCIEVHWQTVLSDHFAQEERLIRILGDAVDIESVARFFSEHAELRMLACEPGALEPSARLRRFGDLLAAHVRFEERVLFPQMQSHPCIDSAAAESTGHI